MREEPGKDKDKDMTHQESTERRLSDREDTISTHALNFTPTPDEQALINLAAESKFESTVLNELAARHILFTHYPQGTRGWIRVKTQELQEDDPE